jgi:hypothetical protein
MKLAERAQNLPFPPWEVREGETGIRSFISWSEKFTMPFRHTIHAIIISIR